MNRIVDIEKNQPHEASEVICAKCLKRWYSIRPVVTLLKNIECDNCGNGYVIETGQK